MATVHHNDIFVLTADEHFGEAFEPLLKSHGYDVRIMSDVSSVLRALESHPPALLLIDRRIPDLRDLLDLEAFRKTLHVVVQLQECACTEDECIEDMESGFDAVICNQSLRYIIARIRAILKRQERIREDEQLVVGWLSLDRERHEVKVDGHVTELTHIQFRILELMMREPGRAFTREELVERIWGEGFAVQDATLDVHIHAIRKKIERDLTLAPRCKPFEDSDFGYKHRSDSFMQSLLRCDGRPVSRDPISQHSQCVLDEAERCESGHNRAGFCCVAPGSISPASHVTGVWA